MLIILLAMAAAMLWSSQPSWSGKRLHRWLVERPAEWLSRMSRWQVAAALGSIVAIVVAVHVFDGDGEGVRLVGSSVLEGATWFVAFDIGTWIEVYAVLWLLGASRQARFVASAGRALVAKMGPRVWQACRRGGRQALGRIARRPPRGGRDEDPDPAGWAWRGAVA